MQHACDTPPHEDAGASHTPPTHATPEAQYPGPPDAPLSQPVGAVVQQTCPGAPQLDPGSPGVRVLQPLVPEPELHPDERPQEHPSQPPYESAITRPTRIMSGAHRDLMHPR